AFTGGVWVGAADVDGDGHAEIVTGAGIGGGPHVRVIRFDGSLTEVASFYAYDPQFIGGVSVASPAPAPEPLEPGVLSRDLRLDSPVTRAVAGLRATMTTASHAAARSRPFQGRPRGRDPPTVDRAPPQARRRRAQSRCRFHRRSRTRAHRPSRR